MTTLIADAINYKQAHVVKGSYYYTKNYPIEGLGNYAVTNNQGPITTFQLVPNVLNCSRSNLSGVLSLPAQGAGNYSYINVNGFKPIQRITVQPQGGPLLLDTTDTDRYLDIVSRKSFSFSDVQGWGTPAFFEGLIPSNSLNSSTVRLDNNSVAKPGQESSYVAASTVNAAFNFTFKMGFDKFVDTFLAVDHDLYFNTPLTITIYWNTLARYCWMTTSATNPTTGAAALAVDAGAAIQNPYIMLAIQNNEHIKKEVMEKCLSQAGLSIKIPYIYYQLTPIAAGGNNLQVWYNSGQGSHWKKTYWSVYPQSPATPNLFYDKNTLGGAKIVQYQTQINGINIQQFPIIPFNGDGFLMDRNSLRGSSMISLNEYLYNFSHCENFCETNNQFLKTLFPEVPNDNLIDGLPLMGSQVQYNIIATTSENLNNVLFSVFLKTLRISGEMITLE